MAPGVFASANSALLAWAVFRSSDWADSMQEMQDRNADGWPLGPFAVRVRPGMAAARRR